MGEPGKASAASSPAAPPPQTTARRGSNQKKSATSRRNSRNQQQQMTTPTSPPATPGNNNPPGASSATTPPSNPSRPTLTPQSSSTRRKLLKPSVEKIESRGVECVVHRWDPPAPFFRHNNLDPPSSAGKLRPKNGVCCVYHGLAGHARFPTVRYLAEILALKCQFVVYGIDFPGHGLSPGVRGYVPSADALIEDGLAVAEHARRRHPNLPLFLAGSSMGGAVAMSVSLCFSDPGDVTGLVLLAPMIKIDVPRWQRNMLRVFSKVSPHKALIPCSDDGGEHQFRDPARRREVNSDTLAYSGNLRVASAYSCMKLYAQTREHLADIRTPFLCLVAENDEVVDNTGAEELLEQCRHTRDKTLKSYDALHGLLCEPQPLRGKIERDIVDWMTTRARREWKRREMASDSGGGISGGGSLKIVRAGVGVGGSDRSLASSRSAGGGASASGGKRRSSAPAVPATATVADLALAGSSTSSPSTAAAARGGVPAKTKELRDAFLSDLEDALNM